MKIIKIFTTMCISLAAICLNFSVINAKEMKTFPLLLTDDRVEYTQTIAFDFMEKLPAPKAKADGRGAPLEKLVSNYGDSYINDTYLHDEVINFRKWEWNEMYTSLDKKAKENPDYLDTYRLQAEAYLVNKEYNEALSQLDQILRRNPKDIHALSLSILANKCGALNSQTSVRLKALNLISPEAYTRIKAILKDCDDNNVNKKAYSGTQLVGLTPDAIAVFGQSPNSDGTPSAALLTRLTKTKEMAEKYPDAKIVLSGGPVKTEYAEADVMAKWLKENGISEDRLLLDDQARDTPGNAMGMVELFKTINAHKILCVGTIMHCPRAMTVLLVYGKAIGYEMQLDAVGGGDQPTNTQKNTERLYTYVNALRAGYFYTKEDFNDYKISSYNVNLYNQNKELIGNEKVEVGNKIQTKAPLVKGYRFVNWTNENGLAVSVDEPVLSDLNLYTNYNPINYKITYNLSGGKTDGLTEVNVNYFDNIKLPKAPIKEGYTFEGWFIGSTKLEANMIYGDLDNLSKDDSFEVIAKWNKNPLVIENNTDKNDGGPNINTKVNTGDNAQVTLWVSLLILSSLFALGYVVNSKKRKNN